MAADYFLFFDKGAKIEGETNDETYTKEKAIELLSWSWGETNSGSHASNSGGGTGKVSMQDFHFTMRMNTASQALFLACATGKHIPTATLVCRKSGQDKPVEYLKIVFTDCLVSSYQTGGSDGAGDDIPVDQISINFTKMTMDYAPQGKDGKASFKGPVGYDLKVNKKV